MMPAVAEVRVKVLVVAVAAKVQVVQVNQAGQTLLKNNCKYNVILTHYIYYPNVLFTFFIF